MIYTEKTKLALKIMYDKHKDQVDKSGMPYVFHPFTVAQSMDDEDSTIVALLHDVLEDTDTTVEELLQYGFNDEVIEALKFLNHDKSVDYYEYVRNVSNNSLAAKVKKSDIMHNSDLTRLNSITDEDLKRVEKYKVSLDILNENVKERIN